MVIDILPYLDSVSLRFKPVFEILECLKKLSEKQYKSSKQMREFTKQVIVYLLPLLRNSELFQGNVLEKQQKGSKRMH